jgi:hypothetical protein
MKAIGMTLAAAAVLLAGSVGLAQAQPTVATTPSCAGLSHAAAAEAWWGRFAGGRNEPTARTVAPSGVVVEGCFSSAAACRRWLYEMKGEYSALPTLAACSQGYGNGPTWPRGSRG